VKKPQAFRHSTLRKELLPSVEFHTIWHALDAELPPKEACKVMVGLLHIAAQEDCEQALAQRVLTTLNEGKPISLSQLQSHFQKSATVIPDVVIVQHTLTHYNQCIPSQQEIAHA
jgi:hypothetical protein